MLRKQYVITEKQYEQLRTIAFKMKLSMSQIIREAIELFITANKGKLLILVAGLSACFYGCAGVPDKASFYSIRNLSIQDSSRNFDADKEPPISWVDVDPDTFKIEVDSNKLPQHGDTEVKVSIADLKLSAMLSSVFEAYHINYVMDEGFADEKDKIPEHIRASYKGKLSVFLDSISERYGLSFHEENGVIRVSAENTYSFSVPSIFLKTIATGSSPTGSAASASQQGDSSSITLITNSLQAMGASFVNIDTNNSIVVFKAKRNKIPHIKKYLDKLKDNMVVVSMDILIAEVTLTDNKERGVNWSLIKQKADLGKTVVTGYNMNLPVNDKVPNFTIDIIKSPYNFTSILDFLDTQGDTRVLQKPTIAVLNGQTARLKAGTEVPYVSQISLSPTQIGTSITYTQSVTFDTALDGFDININPKLSSGDTISINLNGTLNAILDYVDRDIGNGSKVTRPIKATREISSITSVKPGDTLKIGGIIVDKNVSKKYGLPYASQVPVLDLVSSSKSDTTTKSEIVFLIKCKLIKFKDKNYMEPTTTVNGRAEKTQAINNKTVINDSIGKKEKQNGEK